jgi:hypothetical protein
MITTLQPNLGNNSIIDELLHSYQDIFKEPTRLPPLRAHDYVIPLKEGSQPINLRPYCHAGLQKDIVEKIVTEMLDSGIIQHSTSPFASPVVLVKKKDYNWRLCVDYRALNQMTIKDKFLFPIVEELLEELGRAIVFSKVDQRAVYHQIRMFAGDIRKIAFRTHNGYYEFLVMPFDLTNASATFQSLMNDIFRRHLQKFILVFFDDILVYSPILEKHVEQLQIVFEILRSQSLLAKRSKCVFSSSQMEYLGHVITKSGVATDPLKIQAIVNWPFPRNIKQLRGFLGLISYYRRFVKGYGAICKPLTQLPKKDSYKWNQEATVAFDNLKRAMTNPPVLALPDMTKLFVIEIDASGIGVRAVLMQEGHPITFLSKALGRRQQPLPTYEREMFAILQAVAKWKHYLWERHCHIKTDHIGLNHLLDQKVTYPSQHLWLTKLLGFDYETEYRRRFIKDS